MTELALTDFLNKYQKAIELDNTIKKLQKEKDELNHFLIKKDTENKEFQQFIVLGKILLTKNESLEDLHLIKDIDGLNNINEKFLTLEFFKLAQDEFYLDEPTAFFKVVNNYFHALTKTIKKDSIHYQEMIETIYFQENFKKAINGLKVFYKKGIEDDLKTLKIEFFSHIIDNISKKSEVGKLFDNFTIENVDKIDFSLFIKENLIKTKKKKRFFLF